ncbi:MAG: DNA-methyltransferase [Bacteroidota bacterium]
MMIAPNYIYEADCLELLPRFAPDSVDLVICDGPYGVTNYEWDRIDSIQKYNLMLLESFSRVLKPGGSLYLFGKENAIDFIDYRPFLDLKRRIIWYQPSRLAQGRKNYTNNYDVIFYFTKGKAKTFNLDDIRVEQMVELTHRKRCENVPSVKNGQYGKTKFNPKGKNPGDVWGDIKQLTYKSKELISRDYLNTIQKPKKLLRRMVLASSNPGDVVLDPFAGTGTSVEVCIETGRDYIAIEQDPELVAVISARRIESESILEGQLFS